MKHGMRALLTVTTGMLALALVAGTASGSTAVAPSQEEAVRMSRTMEPKPPKPDGKKPKRDSNLLTIFRLASR